MDYFFLAITIVQVLVGGILTIFLARLSRRTRYIPTALLGSYFALLTIAFVLTIPLFWLPNTPLCETLARIFQNTSVVFLFLMFVFLIVAFEGMKGRFFSPITTIFSSFTAFIFGFLTFAKPWKYTYYDMWYQETTLEFDILFIIYGLTAVGIVLYRLIQFISEKGLGRSKKMPTLALIGFLGAVTGGVGLYLIEIPNIDYLSAIIGIAIMAIIYIKDPKSFFLSNTRISAIMLINQFNKLPYLIIGERMDSKSHLHAAGLGGVMMLLSEILETEDPPTRLIHVDKGLLLEHDIKHGITGVIVVDHINDALRRPLKYALALFIKKYEKEIAHWTGEVSVYMPFEIDLRSIFDFAIV